MTAFAWAMGCWLVSAVGAFALRGPIAARTAFAGALAGCAAALVAATRVLAAGPAELWRISWTLPVGALALRLDPLCAVFLLPIAVIGGTCAIFGWRYLQGHDSGEERARSLALYNVLLASMALVVAANDLMLLLISWEAMTLSSWALVVSDHREPDVRDAGLVYLAAAHVGTAALIIFVLLLSSGGNFQIDAVQGVSTASPALFLLALVGFGTKAGLFPLHVWLPDAHPAAPSHVSALMSAVLVTMGVYGLARFLPLLGAAQVWCAYLLMVLGMLGALAGISFGLAQRDVKRILAYSTVENAGIIAVALGLGLLGGALHNPVLAGAGWVAALLHVWNHALAKGALFLGFGAIAQAVGSRQLDALGGMLRQLRILGAVLILLAGAMAALPGLNLFTSEWLLLTGLISGATGLRGMEQVMLLVPFVALGLAGALALACFARLAGVGLVGNARTPRSASMAELSWWLRGPVITLAAGCVVIALFPAQVARILGPAVNIVAPAADLGFVQQSLPHLGWLLPALVAGMLFVVVLRYFAALRSRPERSTTWACGYAAPTAAMQYTSTSFSGLLTSVLQPVLRVDTQIDAEPRPDGIAVWPVRMTWSSRSLDRVLTSVYLRVVRLISRLGLRIRRFQKARVTTSILYIVAVVLLLLALLFLPGNQV